MAITYVNSGRQTGTSVSSFTQTIDVGSGENRLLVVNLILRSASLPTVSAITYNSTALTSIGVSASQNLTNDIIVYQFYLANPSSGSNTLSVTLSGTTSAYECQASWYTGVKQTSPLDDTDSATGNSTTPAASITPTENDCLIVGGMVSDYHQAPSTGSGETVLFNQDNGAWSTASSYAIQTTAAAQSINWSAGSDPWAVVAAAYKSEPATNAPPTVALDTADDSTLNDTTPTLLFTPTDADADDVRVNIQISTSDTFQTGEQLADSYAPATTSAIHPNPTGATTWDGENQVDDRPGQSFTGDGGILTQIDFYLSDFRAETAGTALVRIYAHSGTYGTSSAPANAADPADTPTPDWLAVSDGVVLDSADTTGWYSFEFTGANQIRLEAGTYYLAIFDWLADDTDYDNTVAVNGSTALAHAGNCYLDGASEANNGVYSSVDLLFKIYETYTLIDDVSGTDSGFANVDTPADTDPFNSGDQLSFTVQAGDTLLDGAIYHWRVRGIDPSGSNTYGDWATARSFTVSVGTSVALDTAGVTAGGIALDVVPGAVSITLDTAAVTAGGVALDVVPVTNITLDTAGLTAGGIALDVVPGAVSVTLDTAGVTAGGVALDVVPGAVSTTLDTAGVTAAGIGLDVTPGAVSVNLDTANVTTAGIGLDVTPGAVSISLDVAGVTAAGIGLDVTPGAVSVTLDTANVTTAGIGLDVVPGAVSISLDVAGVTAGGQTITVTAGDAPQTVSLDTANVTASGIGLDVVPGAVSITLDVAALVIGSGITVVNVSPYTGVFDLSLYQRNVRLTLDDDRTGLSLYERDVRLTVEAI